MNFRWIFKKYSQEKAIEKYCFNSCYLRSLFVISPRYESKLILCLSSKVQYSLFWYTVLNLCAVWSSLLLLERFEKVREMEETELVFTFLEVKVTPGKIRKYLVHRLLLHIVPLSCRSSLVSLMKSCQSWTSKVLSVLRNATNPELPCRLLMKWKCNENFMQMKNNFIQEYTIPRKAGWWL